MAAQRFSNSFTIGDMMINYDEFGRLRFLDWFPENDAYSSGAPASECAIGFAIAEGYGFTYFARKAEKPQSTAEVALDFGDDCPEEQGNALLAFLGLDLARGSSEQAVNAVLGASASRTTGPGGQIFSRYIIDGSDAYYANCTFDGTKGLQQILIYRKDLANWPETRHSRNK
jgi:hypothetical protein